MGLERNLTDEDEMPFGIHKGKKLANVPAEYLLFCNDQPWCRGGLKGYIVNNLDVLKSQTKNKK